MGNIDSGNMSRYMSAKVVPTLDTLISIADAANVTLDWLAIGVGPKFRSEIGKAVSIASLYK
jgi:transcriptional regulator with XRE-family HTH domain